MKIPAHAKYQIIYDTMQKNDNETVQNIMVIATDSQIKLENEVKVNIPENEIILTDDRCPVDNLIPIID